MQSEPPHSRSSGQDSPLPGVAPAVERAGKAFVAAWLLNNSVRIEDWLKDVPEDLQAEAHDLLIRLEIYMRAAHGDTLDEDDYIRRFPDYEVEIEAAFHQDGDSGTVSAQTRSVPSADSAGSMIADSLEDVIPERMGRYKIESVLGTGGFGVVCLAEDTELNRRVALKFARTSRFRNKKEVNDLINEARTAAQLDHPGIVAVHDVLLEGDMVGIVQQLIEGKDLAEELGKELPAFERVAELLIGICNAIAFAHSRGFVHRDLKPANILIDDEGNPHIADFGLAIHESFQRRRRGDQSGTPRYMSPELVRGESHRVDGRSDIWSIGVMMYRMLTGHRPFAGETRAELFDEVKHREPRPPRQIRSGIPQELERICLKCLNKPVSGRYATAKDLAEDLRYWLREFAGPLDGDSNSDRFADIVPRGLRAFDADDADFFLKLLPGPRARNGLPDSIRLWKQRIEHRDADRLQIGLLYGPSGCGKSSFVQAGLIPHLASYVKVVRIDATASDTEVRLIKALRIRYPEIPTELTLPELFHSLREGVWTSESDQVLVVIDQFEQWLHNRSSYPNTELVEALRHCDGEHLQCLLMVRDDFWLATSRFLKALEINLVEGRNAGLVDLFDKPHAEKVLRRYGRGYGRLQDELTRQENDFVTLAVDELADEDRVICVRLSLFAEMFRDKTWNPATLRKVGGISGVGVAFLEDTFSSKNARPEHRLHEQAARKVLGGLLPDSSIDIRGNMRSRHDLLHMSGYASRPAAFSDLLRILDNELRLITPTDPEGPGNSQETDPAASRAYYQLTHDYLVAPLRSWLNQKKRETRRGRARLRLDERNATWSRTRENRYLPSIAEYLNIRSMTRPASWTAGEKTLMKKADRVYGSRFLVVVLLLLVAGLLGRQWYGNLRANTLAKRITEADFPDVPAIMIEAKPWQDWLDPRLQTLDVEGDESKQLNIELALSHLPKYRSQLWDRLTTRANALEIPLIAAAITPDPDQLDELWNTLRQPPGRSGDRARLRAAAALAHWMDTDFRWPDVSANVAESMMNQESYYIGEWAHALSPIREQISRALVQHATNWQFGSFANQLDPGDAVSILQNYCRDSPDFITYLESLVDEFDYRSRSSEGPEANVDQFETLSRKQANVATILASLGQMKRVLPLLDSTANQRTRELLIEQFPIFATDAAVLFELIPGQTDPDIQAALWLALGNFVPDGESVHDSDPWLKLARSEFTGNGDARVHSATEWLIRRMSHSAWIDQTNSTTVSAVYPPRQSWRNTVEGHTMIRIENPGQKFVMSQDRHARIDYDFEVSAMEVNIEQMLSFNARLEDDGWLIIPDSGPYSHVSVVRKRPASNVYWFLAAEYCNWLSEREGIPKDQWCYEPHPDPVGEFDSYSVDADDPHSTRPALRLVEDYRERSGFRLPLESEWDWLAAPRWNTRLHTENFKRLLSQYETTGDSNGGKYVTRPGGLKKPQRYGLFDLFGNVTEYCTDSYGSLFLDNKTDVKLKPGSEYLDPVALAKLDQELGGFQSNKLDKGISVIRRGLDDHRGNSRPSDKGLYTGFRVVRILPGKEK